MRNIEYMMYRSYSEKGVEDKFCPSLNDYLTDGWKIERASEYVPRASEGGGYIEYILVKDNRLEQIYDANSVLLDLQVAVTHSYNPFSLLEPDSYSGFEHMRDTVLNLIQERLKDPDTLKEDISHE